MGTDMALLDPHVIRDAIALIGEPGRWMQNQMDDGARVCAHGAVLRQHCTPGDEHLWRLVMRTKGLDEEWNDAAGRTSAHITVRLNMLVNHVTEADMIEAIGPNWKAVRGFTRRVAALTTAEIHGLSAPGDIEEARRAACHRPDNRCEVGRAVADAAGHCLGLGREERGNALRLARCCAEALASRGEIDQAHYDVLTRPFRDIGVTVHRDDPELRAA